MTMTPLIHPPICTSISQFSLVNINLRLWKSWQNHLSIFLLIFHSLHSDFFVFHCDFFFIYCQSFHLRYRRCSLLCILIRFLCLELNFQQFLYFALLFCDENWIQIQLYLFYEKKVHDEKLEKAQKAFNFIKFPEFSFIIYHSWLIKRQ